MKIVAALLASLVALACATVVASASQTPAGQAAGSYEVIDTGQYLYLHSASADGKVFVTGNSNQSYTSVFDVTTGEFEQPPMGGYPSYLSPSGEHVVVASNDPSPEHPIGWYLYLWTRSTGKVTVLPDWLYNGGRPAEYVDDQGRLYFSGTPRGVSGEDLDHGLHRYDPSSGTVDTLYRYSSLPEDDLCYLNSGSSNNSVTRQLLVGSEEYLFLECQTYAADSITSIYSVVRVHLPSGQRTVVAVVEGWPQNMLGYPVRVSAASPDGHSVVIGVKVNPDTEPTFPSFKHTLISIDDSTAPAVDLPPTCGSFGVTQWSSTGQRFYVPQGREWGRLAAS